MVRKISLQLTDWHIRPEGDIIKTQRRKVIRELDGLPFPAWDLLDITPYRTSVDETAGYFSYEYGNNKRLSFQMQLVRETDLWKSIQFAVASKCCRGIKIAEREISV